jgi:hypothetical protein
MAIRSFLQQHVLDSVVIVAYLALVLFLGRAGAKATRNEEGFFLANRSLGKLYQFFLNFGQSTDPQGAVSTASTPANITSSDIEGWPGFTCSGRNGRWTKPTRVLMSCRSQKRSDW